MIKRSLARQVSDRLFVNPAVAILGPHQVGKTTLAKGIAKDVLSVYLDLEDEKDRRLLEDPDRYLGMHEYELVVIDGVQRLPGLFKSLRVIIDKRRRKGINAGQFLLLGAASKELLKQSSESLAGRISYLELAGLSPGEIGVAKSADLQKLWARGGFPQSFLARNDQASYQWRREFIRTYLERHIPTLGPRISADTLLRFWKLLAKEHGEPLNASNLGREIDVANVTAARYLDMMEDLMLVRRLKPWSGNVAKRLVKTPRVYIRDSGIAHALLEIADYDSLYMHPAFGKSWEGFVIEKILSYLPFNVLPFYYRTAQGAEINLVLEFGPGKCWAIEIRASRKPRVSKGFHIASADLGAKRKLVVHSGADEFSLGNNTTAISLSKLMLML